MIKQVCQFVLAAGLVGIALAPSDADAKYRNIDGHGCRVVSSGFGSKVFDCALPTGTDFRPSTIDVISADGRTSPGWVTANVCRRTFGEWTVTCGAASSLYYATQGNYLRFPDPTVLKGGNAWDYRWVHVIAPDTDTTDLNGVYMNNTDL